MEENKQIDIKKLEVAELWKLAFDQQKQITTLLVQLQQAQTNVAAIEAEIEARSKEVKK